MRTCKDITHVRGGVSYSRVSSISFQPSLINSLRVQELPSGDTVAKKYTDDIYLLFNQKRLENLGVDTINNWLSSLRPASDALSNLRAKCSDDELLSLVKSRHIQSQSELLAWSEYLNYNFSSILNKINESSPDNSDNNSVSDTADNTDVASS